jgi:hypothetical protein
MSAAVWLPRESFAMPVPVNCEQCQAHYLIDDKFAGKRAKCKKCGHIMAIPLPAGPGGKASSPHDDTSGGEIGVEPPAPWETGKPGVPKGWRPDSVVVERDEDVTDIPIEQGHSYAAASVAPIGPLVPALIGLFAASVLALAIIAQVSLDDPSVNASIPIWAKALLQLTTFFAVIGPLAMVGVKIASQIRGFRLARPTYLRATAAAALPLAAALWLGKLVGNGNELVFLVAVLAVGAITFQVIRTLFYLESISGLVSTGCALVTGLIGFGVSLWLITLSMSFVPIPPEPTGPLVNTSGSRAIKVDPETEEGGDETPTTAPDEPGTPDVSALRNASKERLGLIASAIQRHFVQHDGIWPNTLDELVAAGGLAADELRSPFAAEGAAAGGYAYGRSPSRYAKAGEVVVAYDAAELEHPTAAHGTSVLFGDLSVRWLERAELDRAIARSQELIAQAPPDPGATANVAPTPKPSVAPDPVVRAPQPNPGAAAPRPEPPGPEAEFVARVRESLGPVARDVTPVRVPSGLAGVITTSTPSSTFALVARNKTESTDVIELWSGSPPRLKGSATFKIDAQARGANYAVAADGDRVVRVGTFPRLSARIWSAETSRDGTSLDLDRNNGTPHLLGFLDADRFLIRWERGTKHGLEVWDATAGKSRRRIDLPDHEPTPTNEAVSPDGKLFAHAVRADGANQLVLQQLLVGKPRVLPITALDTRWSIRPAGIAFSPDSTKVAVLFAHQGDALVLVWNVRGGKPIAEIIVPTAVKAIRSPDGQPARSLDWVAGGNALLVCGTLILDAGTGDLIAELDAANVVGQSAGEGNVFRVVTARANSAGAMVVVELDPAELPKPDRDAKPAVRPRPKPDAPARGGAGTGRRTIRQ